jgi:hypothetical protein
MGRHKSKSPSIKKGGRIHMEKSKGNSKAVHIPEVFLIVVADSYQAQLLSFPPLS